MTLIYPYQCFECDNDPTTTEEFSWRSLGKSYTRAYQDHVLRKKETVLRFLAQIPSKLKATIENVAKDMYEGYLNAVKEALGEEMEIVIDRFHVAQTYRKGADSLIKEEQKRLKQELDKAEYEQLKGLPWAFCKNPNDLKAKDHLVLNIAFNHSPDLKKAYELRNAMTDIFDKPCSKQEGIASFQARH